MAACAPRRCGPRAGLDSLERTGNPYVPALPTIAHPTARSVSSGARDSSHWAVRRTLARRSVFYDVSRGTWTLLTANAMVWLVDAFLVQHLLLGAPLLLQLPCSVIVI